MTALGPLLEKARRLPPIAVDGAIGVGIFATGGVALALGGLPPAQRPSALGILALEALGVTFRRKKLWVAYANIVLASASGLFMANEAYGALLSQFVLLYTVSERCGLGVSLLALAAFNVTINASGWFTFTDPKITTGQLLDAAINGLPYPALVWFAGRAQKRRSATASGLEQSMEELREERDRLARSAVATERARIARELYELVVRGVERMSAETHSARRQLKCDPGEASEAIATVETGGRGVLLEMRRLLVVLRTQNRGSGPSTVGELPRREAVPSPSGNDRRSLAAASLTASRWTLTSRFAQRVRRLVAIPWVTDGLVVLLMAILFVAELLWANYWLQRRSAVVLAVIVVAALMFRRVAPIPVLFLITSVSFVQDMFLGGASNTADRAIFVAVFTVAALRGPRWAVVAVVAEVVAYAPYLLIPGTCGPACQIGWDAFFVFVVIAGLGVREARRLNTELAEQTELLRRTREERIRLAVREERTRIARDVHDMVAHGVTLMVIQAGAARWLAETDPLKANQALRAVESAGEEALSELHSLVISLDGAPTASQAIPTGEQLTIPSVVAHEIESGMHVELVIDGEPRPLDAGLELSLHRIVQEALTNVRKHAPGARAWVELRYTADGVEVEVTDTGGGESNAQRQGVPGAGQGLVGIRERAALFGGHAEAAPTPEGGFRVQASLHEERVLV